MAFNGYVFIAVVTFTIVRVQPSANDTGLIMSSSLPRSGGSGNVSSSSSSSSSTLPSRGSPASSPGINSKQQSPSRYRQKQQHKQQQQQANGFVKKTSPLTMTKIEPTKRPERQSSPEILMTETTVLTEQQNRDGEEELSVDVIQEQSEQRQEEEQLYNDIRPQPAEVVKETEDDKFFETQSTIKSDITKNPVDSTTTTKPAVIRRPKIPPKPLPPPPPCRKSLDAQTVIQNKPIPRPRSRGDTPLSDDGRRSCSPSVFDDELDLKQIPPAKPPRRRSAQISSTTSFSDDNPSPVATNRHTFHSTAVSPTYPVEKSSKMINPPPLPSRQSKPALPPKPKTRTSITSTIGLDQPQVLVAERLNLDEIDLADSPYSNTVSD